MQIAAGAVRAYYLRDVANTIDLSRLRTLGGQGLAPADIPLRPHTSGAYIRLEVPPLVGRLADARVDDLECTVRLKLFDYGIVAVRLSFDAAGSWEDAAALAERVRSDEAIARYAQGEIDRICSELGQALVEPHAGLVEDYFVIDVERFAEPVQADDLLRSHSAQLARILLGESQPLSASEVEESLRVRFSYFPDDLTIVQWDTAFVYDRRESSDAIQDILEFANSQLLELRSYDSLLDSELDSIYRLRAGRSTGSLLSRREAAGLRQVIVDVLELLDRSSNALKVVGDAYYARVYHAAAARLGLADWQKQIDTKLKSVDDMYRFVMDQSHDRRNAFLELIVIVLIAMELIVGIATLVRH